MDKYREKEIRLRAFSKLWRKRVIESAGMLGIANDPLTGAVVYQINCPAYGFYGYPAAPEFWE